MFKARLYGFGVRSLDKVFPDVSAEVSLRYIPVASFLHKKKADSVLEVGSGATGITPYYKHAVTAVDPVLSEGYVPLITALEGSAQALPVKDSSFDAVISLDMLEHIPVADRAKTINEMVRTSRRLVVLGVPSGKTSEQQDLWVDSYYREIRHEPYHFILEHVELGLPTDELLQQWADESLRAHGKTGRVTIVHNTNLRVRRWLMWIWIRAELSGGFYFKLTNLLVPILRFANFGACYRSILYIEMD